MIACVDLAFKFSRYFKHLRVRGYHRCLPYTLWRLNLIMPILLERYKSVIIM